MHVLCIQFCLFPQGKFLEVEFFNQSVYVFLKLLIHIVKMFLSREGYKV